MDSHMVTETDRWRITVDNKTMVFEKETDLTIMRTPTTGKLIHHLVEDGAHLQTNQPFAEIEVMKMVMELRAKASGVIHITRRPGIVLNAEAVLARLDLDDPSKMHVCEEYTDGFPTIGKEASNVRMSKPTCVMPRLRDELDQLLLGFAKPDPYFRNHIQELVDDLMSALRDSSLPLLELQEIMNSVSGRLPVIANVH